MTKARILIVEDEAIIAMEIESDLKRLGYEVTSIVDSGKKAIQKAEIEKPDLVLMDIRIKGELDGIQAAEVIRTQYDIPVIFATAYLDEERIRRAKLTMPFGYILKPIQERDLKVTIEMALFVSKIDAERKQVEDTLRESEERYKVAFKTSPDAVNINRLDGLFVDINDGFTQMTGFTREDAIGKMSADINIWAIPEDRERLIAGLMRDGYYANLETTFRFKDGTCRVGLMSASFIQLNNEPHILSITRDISERKRMEEELRESEERYRLLFERSGDAVFTVERETGRYLDANSAGEKLTGRTVSELQKLTTLDTTIQQAQKRLEKINEISESTDLGEVVYVKPDGSERTALLIAVPFNEKIVFGIARDITDLKKTQALMIQTEKMMSIGSLAAGMAHEINNPLGAMVQSAQNALRRLSPDLKSNIGPARELGIDLQNLQQYLEERGVLSFLNTIRESGKKASQIISNMLQFSRKSESKREPTHLAELMDNVLALAGTGYDLKKKYDFRNINIIKEFAADLPPINCTKTEIEQVILNLLNNAAWAMMNAKGIDSPQIRMAVHIVRGKAQIEVADNGPGMDEKTRKRIFEPFFTTKPVGEGTGLGLSVSYMIITNNHHGTMEVESEPGKGTRFIIRLPLDRS
ncbi:MAG: PAS domain S-box protein [bacterium]